MKFGVKTPSRGLAAAERAGRTVDFSNSVSSMPDLQGFGALGRISTP